jgi:hypothetical protein
MFGQTQASRVEARRKVTARCIHRLARGGRVATMLNAIDFASGVLQSAWPKWLAAAMLLVASLQFGSRGPSWYHYVLAAGGGLRRRRVPAVAWMVAGA